MARSHPYPVPRPTPDPFPAPFPSPPRPRSPTRPCPAHRPQLPCPAPRPQTCIWACVLVPQFVSSRRRGWSRSARPRSVSSSGSLRRSSRSAGARAGRRPTRPRRLASARRRPPTATAGPCLTWPRWTWMYRRDDEEEGLSSERRGRRRRRRRRRPARRKHARTQRHTAAKQRDARMTMTFVHVKKDDLYRMHTVPARPSVRPPPPARPCVLPRPPVRASAPARPHFPHPSHPRARAAPIAPPCGGVPAARQRCRGRRRRG